MNIKIKFEIIHRHGVGDCSKCPSEKKKKCNTLCSEAEVYVNQDEVKQRELTIGLPRTEGIPDMPSNIYFTEKEYSILTLLGRGLSRRDVCEVLNITRESLRFHIFNLRKKTNGFSPL